MSLSGLCNKKTFEKFAKINSIGNYWINRIVFSYLCCGKVYRVESKNATKVILTLPYCECKLKKFYIEHIITNSRGYSNKRLKYRRINDQLYYVVSSIHNNSDNLKAAEYALLCSEPAEVIDAQEIKRRFDFVSKQWTSGRNHLPRFDVQNFSYFVSKDNKHKIVSHVDFCRVPSRSLEDASRLELIRLYEFYRPSRTVISEDLFSKELSVDELLKHKYQVNLRRKLFFEIYGTMYRYIIGSTYYGFREMLYFMNVITNPSIQYYEKHVFEPIYSKYSSNEDVNLWALYDGEDINEPSLLEEINDLQFNTSYDMFVKNIMSHISYFVDKSSFTYYCNKNLDCCLKNNSGDNFDKNVNKWPTVLLSDAIKDYASKHNDTLSITIKSIHGYSHVYDIKNVSKYTELWKFVDLLNVYAPGKLKYITNELGVIEKTNYERVPWKKFWTHDCMEQFQNRYMNPFTKFVNNLIKSKKPNSDYAVYDMFCDCFNSYLKEYESNHVHNVDSKLLYTQESNMYTMHSIKHNTTVIWPGDENILQSETDVCAIKIASCWLEKMYRPESNFVVKNLNEHFNDLCEVQNNTL